MHKPIATVLSLLLVISAVALYSSRSLAAAKQQAGEKQSSPPEQQQSSQAQPQGSSSAAVSSVTGCLVRTNSGYSIKTDTDTYPIETERDLSKYINKKIKISGILEHHNAAATPSTENSNAIAVTDIRLRMVASVVGDCTSQ